MTPSKRRGTGITLDPDELRYVTTAADSARGDTDGADPARSVGQAPPGNGQRDQREGHGCGGQTDRGTRRARRRALPR